MTSVAIYVRVSTKEQGTDAQLTELRDYARLKGYQIHGEYIDVITGDITRRNSRTRHDDLLEDASGGKFQAILVWRYDRFARSVSHLSASLEHFQKLGVGFISFKENVDTTTPMGKLFFHLLASFAEFERTVTRERCLAGIRLVKETGRNSRGEPSRLGRREEVSQEQKEKILQAFSAGEKLQVIAASVSMPLPSVYTIIRRNVLPCPHGKYRCSACRKLGRIQMGATPSGATTTLGRRARRVPRHVGDRTTP